MQMIIVVVNRTEKNSFFPPSYFCQIFISANLMQNTYHTTNNTATLCAKTLIVSL